MNTINHSQKSLLRIYYHFWWCSRTASIFHKKKKLILDIAPRGRFAIYRMIGARENVQKSVFLETTFQVLHSIFIVFVHHWTLKVRVNTSILQKYSFFKNWFSSIVSSTKCCISCVRLLVASCVSDAMDFTHITSWIILIIHVKNCIEHLDIYGCECTLVAVIPFFPTICENIQKMNCAKNIFLDVKSLLFFFVFCLELKIRVYVYFL